MKPLGFFSFAFSVACGPTTTSTQTESNQKNTSAGESQKLETPEDIDEFKALRHDPRESKRKRRDSLVDDYRDIPSQLKKIKEEEKRVNEDRGLTTMIENALTDRGLKYSSLKLTESKETSPTVRKIRFTFKNDKEFCVGYAVIIGNDRVSDIEVVAKRALHDDEK